MHLILILIYSCDFTLILYKIFKEFANTENSNKKAKDVYYSTLYIYRLLDVAICVHKTIK